MKKYKETIKQADQTAKNGKTEEAFRLYKEAIGLEPERVDAYYNIALLYHQQGQLDEAIANFEKAAELAPNDASVFNNLGVIYHSKGLLDKAERNLGRAITINGRYLEPLYGLARIRVKKGDLLGARALLGRCLKIDPSFEKAKRLWNEIAVNYQTYAANLNVTGQGVHNKGIVYRRDIDYTVLPQIVHEEARCCFALSTGRCGTKLLTNLLRLSKGIQSVHEPLPVLVYPSKLAYETSHEDREKFRLGIDMARYEFIENAFLRNQIYVETNNRLTFFAPFLAEVFKQSKFIHLVRHPGDFVRSGIRRMWYSGKHSYDTGRIVPTDNNINWYRMTQIEKIAWLWNETNQFIEDFKLNLADANGIIFVKAEDLFSRTETAVKIFEFLQVEPPPEKQISEVIKRPVNVQKIGNFPKYDKWNPEWKEQLKRYATLFSKYDYNGELAN